jgi:hypothetical protein
MKPNIGLWIDHRNAIIVTLGSKGEEVARVFSQVEPQLRRSGDSPLKGRHEKLNIASDTSQKRALTGKFNIYYDAVSDCLGRAGSIFLFGPGEAKGELKKRLVRNKLGARIVQVEPSDKMTDRQISAKVRQYFAVKPTDIKG